MSEVDFISSLHQIEIMMDENSTNEWHKMRLEFVVVFNVHTQYDNLHNVVFVNWMMCECRSPYNGAVGIQICFAWCFSIVVVIILLLMILMVRSQ